jgi:hypothetical protein
MRDEAASRFGMPQALAQRYVLMGLLGKGGFSEVFKVWPRPYEELQDSELVWAVLSVR